MLNQSDLFHGMTNWPCYGEMMNMVYLKFSKAFNKLFHEILLEKMTNYGLPYAANRWIQISMPFPVSVYHSTSRYMKSYMVHCGVVWNSVTLYAVQWGIK